MKKENISCEVIQDLLPLYEDQYCSEASRVLVEEHLKECEICRKKSKSFQAEIPLPPDGMKDPDVQGIKKGIRKMKRIRVCNDKIREATLYFTENIEQGRLDKLLEEMDRNVGRYYMLPTLNETICELLYEDSNYDWRVLFKD